MSCPPSSKGAQCPGIESMENPIFFNPLGGPRVFGPHGVAAILEIWQVELCHLPGRNFRAVGFSGNQNSRGEDSACASPQHWPSKKKKKKGFHHVQIFFAKFRECSQSLED